MIKKIVALLFLLCFAISVQAQNTNVSATVTDSGGVVWANGTYTFNFLPTPRFNGVYRLSGAPYTPVPITGVLSGAGSLTSIPVPDNNLITPTGTQWTVTYCPQASAPCQTSGGITITGVSQTITSNFVPNALVIPAGIELLVYNTNEVPTAPLGSEIFLIGTGIQVCTAVTGTICNTWASAGGGLPTGLTFVSPTLTVSSATNGNGVLALSGNTSGTSTFTAPAVAGTSSNPIVISNTLSPPAGTAGSPAYSFTGGTNSGIYFQGGVGVCVAGGGVLIACGNAGQWYAVTYGTSTKCAANGTAASPSVVTCAAAAAGVFSCGVGAETVCTINTTAMISANSTVIVTQDNSTTTGTLLGITCLTTANPPIVSAKVAATSFSITINAPAVNPNCYQYFIIN